MQKPNTFLDAFVKESARLQPIFAISLPEITTEELTLGYYIIPAGTSVSVDNYGLNRDETKWPNPEQFLPDRFIDNKEEISHFHWNRFGMGPRRCLGWRLGDLLINAVLFFILSKYQIEPATVSVKESKPYCQTYNR